MFKNLFHRNKSQKQQTQKNVAASEVEPIKPAMPAGHEPVKGGTVLRSTEPMNTIEKPVSLLQLAEEGGWEVNNVSEYDIGDTIDGTYKIAKKVSGGMGFVYITEPTGQGIRFAIKQPNRMMLENKSFFPRIIREADTWNGLGMHPNIAYCYFVKLVDGIPYIFIEYVEGGNLREWIVEGQCLDIRASLDMAIQFCHGMEHAHKKGVIHRDIKPENVLMTKDGGVKITDFGLAGALEGALGKVGGIKGGALTQFGSEMGTHEYMSPEQWEGPHNVDERADIFSFGVCMWEMFCGKRPYKIAYGDDIETPTPVQTLRPELTASHVELLYKSIDLNREKRYKDFTELREALNSIYQELYFEDAPAYTIEIPDSLADELNNRGYSYFQLGDKQKARECWEQSLQIAPKHLIATYNLNYLKWDCGEIKSSELIRQLKLTGDRSPEYWLCVGSVYYLRGDHETIKNIQVSDKLIIDTQFLEALEHPEAIGWFVKEFSGHTDYINSVCFSPDGRCFLSTTIASVSIWDVTSGQEISTLWHTWNPSKKSACFSPDGKFVLSGSRNNNIRLWEVTTGKKVKRFKEYIWHTSEVNSVCFSPDGRFILSGSFDNSIRLWDVHAGKKIRRFEGHTKWITSVCFSPDGKIVLSGSADKTIRLWDASTGKEIRRFEGHTSVVQSVCFSPNGRFILSGGWDKSIRLWEAATGKEIRRFEGHTDTVNSVCFSRDGKFVLSGSSDENICLWDAVTGGKNRQFEWHTRSVYSVCFSPDGRYIMSGGSDKTIYLWEISYSVNNLSFPILSVISTSEQRIESQKKATLLFNNAKSAKESGNYKNEIFILRQVQVLEGYRQKLEILDLITICRQNGKCFPIGLKDSWLKKKLLEGHFWDWKGFVIDSVCFSPDGKYILSKLSDHFIFLWETATGKEIWIKEHTDYINSVCFSSDGKFVLSGGGTYDSGYYIDCTIRFWEANTGEGIRKFEGHSKPIDSVCFSPDGKFVASGSEDKTIRLWEVTTGKEIRRFRGHKDMVYLVCFSPDEKHFLSVSRDDTIRLWEASTGEEVRRFGGHSLAVNSVCFSPDGKFFLSESLDSTILWEAVTGKEIIRFKVISVCFSPDGRYILFSSDDTSIRLWEIATGEEIRKFEGHTSNVISVCFFPDGRYILSGSDDKTVRLWEAATGKEIRKFEGHTNTVISVCFSPDGRYFISGSNDKTILLWELDWEWEFP